MGSSTCSPPYFSHSWSTNQPISIKAKKTVGRTGTSCQLPIKISLLLHWQGSPDSERKARGQKGQLRWKVDQISEETYFESQKNT